MLDSLDTALVRSRQKGWQSHPRHSPGAALESALAVAPLGARPEKKSCMGVTSCSHKALQKTLPMKREGFPGCFLISLFALRTVTGTWRGTGYRHQRATVFMATPHLCHLGMVQPQHSPQPALHCSLAEITASRPNNYILHNVATSQTNKSFLRKSTCLKLDLP